MGFVIGFGSTEQAFEDAERKAFEEYVTDRYNELGCDYITDELAKDVSAWLSKRSDQFRAVADGYKTASAFPDRYSYFYVHLIHGASDIIARYSFMHINRRHALSPDGWALMTTKRLFDLQSYDIRKPQASNREIEHA